jgi:hypothetical protein
VANSRGGIETYRASTLLAGNHGSGQIIAFHPATGKVLGSCSGGAGRKPRS